MKKVILVAIVGLLVVGILGIANAALAGELENEINGLGYELNDLKRECENLGKDLDFQDVDIKREDIQILKMDRNILSKEILFYRTERDRVWAELNEVSLKIDRAETQEELREAKKELEKIKGKVRQLRQKVDGLKNELRDLKRRKNKIMGEIKQMREKKEKEQRRKEEEKKAKEKAEARRRWMAKPIWQKGDFSVLLKSIEIGEKFWGFFGVEVRGKTVDFIGGIDGANKEDKTRYYLGLQNRMIGWKNLRMPIRIFTIFPEKGIYGSIGIRAEFGIAEEKLAKSASVKIGWFVGYSRVWAWNHKGSSVEFGAIYRF